MPSAPTILLFLPEISIPALNPAILFTASSAVLIPTLRLPVIRKSSASPTIRWWESRLAESSCSAGGLALYDKKGQIVGALGVSGDTSCADHVVAWKTRHTLGLDAVPMGVAPGPSDNLILDIENGVSSSGFGHPGCKGGNPSEEIIKKLTETYPAGPRR